METLITALPNLAIAIFFIYYLIDKDKKHEKKDAIQEKKREDREKENKELLQEVLIGRQECRESLDKNTEVMKEVLVELKILEKNNKK